MSDAASAPAVGHAAIIGFGLMGCDIAAIFLAVHFWRIRKDGGISGPL